MCGRGKGDCDDDNDNDPEFASQQFPSQEAQEGQQADRGPWLHSVGTAQPQLVIFYVS